MLQVSRTYPCCRHHCHITQTKNVLSFDCQALLVNPYEIGNVAAVLHRALKMPADERELRMNALRKRERANDVDVWMKSFLKAIGHLIEEDGKRTT